MIEVPFIQCHHHCEHQDEAKCTPECPSIPDPMEGVELLQPGDTGICDHCNNLIVVKAVEGRLRWVHSTGLAVCFQGQLLAKPRYRASQ